MTFFFSGRGLGSPGVGKWGVDTVVVMRGERQPYASVFNWSAYKHNLSSDCLFAIKHFQAAQDNIGFLTSVKLLEEHPEYFKKNISV